MLGLRKALRFYCHPLLKILALPWRYLRVTVASVIILLPILYFVNFDELYLDMSGDITDEYLDYISNSAACKLPNINPFHDSIRPFMKNLQPLECGKPSATFENNVLKFEGMNVVSVHYRTITRPYGDDNSVNVSQPIEFPNMLKNIMNRGRKSSPIKPGKIDLHTKTVKIILTYQCF